MKLGEFLIEKGLISREQLAEAAGIAKTKREKPEDVLVELGYITAEQAMQALADLNNYEFFDLRDVPIPPHVVELVPESVARENYIIPLAEEEDALKVLVSDPNDIETIDKLQFILNRKINIALATRESILEAINRNYGQMGDESADSMLQEFTDTAIDFTETETESDDDDEDVDESSAPIVRLVQLMIGEAVQLRASDIHVEPFEDRVRIRYRIDGVLVERDSPPRRLLGALLSRIKILAKMDIAERRRTQDGRIKITA
ncbi:MAG: Flp pilus assembly complex ATPase component TadA, partial [Planctomycetales bacterium]|nr:Flp pilus assembly complex ATPase component TadA [Planctomycetales bacterium]